MDHIFSCKQVTTPCLPLPCKHSPDGATTDCGRRHLIAVYYSFIDTVRMKGWVGLVGWPTADGYPCNWSPVSCRSSARRKFAGQRPTFHHCATRSTISPLPRGSTKGAATCQWQKRHAIQACRSARCPIAQGLRTQWRSNLACLFINFFCLVLCNRLSWLLPAFWHT